MIKKQIVIGCSLAVMLLAGCSGKTESFKKAEQELQEGFFEQAAEDYKESLQLNVKVEKSLRGAGIAELNLGNYEEAVSYFGQALAVGKLSDMQKRELLQYQATAYYRMGDCANAMACCQDLMEYPMDANSYFISGMTALTLNSYDEAERNFQNAFLQDSSYEMAFRIYNAYHVKGMYANSSDYLELALEITPSDAEDYCRRGRCYYYMEQYDEALEELKIASESGSTEAYLVMGEIYQVQGKLAEARAMYQAYISAEGPSARGYNGLAICDMKDGQYESALANIHSGISCADLSMMPDLLFNEAVVYERMLDFSTAYEKMQEYVERYPEDPQAAKELLFLEKRIQQTRENASRTEKIAAEAAENETPEEVYDETADNGQDAYGYYDAYGGDTYDYNAYGYDANGYTDYGWDTTYWGY